MVSSHLLTHATEFLTVCDESAHEAAYTITQSVTALACTITTQNVCNIVFCITERTQEPLHITLQTEAYSNVTITWCITSQHSALTTQTTFTGEQTQLVETYVYACLPNSTHTLTTQYTHTAYNQQCTVNAYAILSDHANFTYTGKLHITPAAHNAASSQKAWGLALADTAKMSAYPYLEIENNSVSCNHGSALAPCDKESLTFASARGMDKKTARRLIVQGFFNQALVHVPKMVKNDLYTLLTSTLCTE